MHEAVEGLQGVEVIGDDFLVCGFGDTADEATKDHDQNLTAIHGQLTHSEWCCD